MKVSKDHIQISCVFGVLVLAYFLIFPSDFALLLGPLETILRLSQSVAPWAYIFLSTIVVVFGATKILGQRSVSD